MRRRSIFTVCTRTAYLICSREAGNIISLNSFIIKYVKANRKRLSGRKALSPKGQSCFAFSERVPKEEHMASGKGREYEEYLRQYEKDHPPVNYAKKDAPVKVRKAKGSGQKSRRQAAKAAKVKKITAAVITVSVLFAITAAIIIFKVCQKNGDPSVLKGVWYYDQYTEYEFDGEGKGCMCIDGSEHFEFDYKISGDTVKVDFLLNYVTDCEYKFTVKNDDLTLIGGEGTAEPGREYSLKRIG